MKAYKGFLMENLSRQNEVKHMKYIVTRRRIYFATVDAKSEEEALFKAKAGLIPESDWHDDDRPDEYSIECDPI